MQHSSFEDVRIEGHLIDSGIMSQVMDHVIARGGEFETLSFEVGRTNEDASVAVLRVRAESRSLLEEILLAIQEHGAVAWVGHAPDVGRLTAALIGQGGWIRLAKGGVAAICFYDAPEVGGGELRWLVTAKMVGC